MTFASTIVEFDVINHTHRKIDFAEVDLSSQKIYWIHCDLNDEAFLATASEKLNFNEDLIFMIKEEEGLPKLVDYEDALTIQIQSLVRTEINSPEEEIDYNDLVFHLTENYCFTACKSKIPAITEFEQSYPKALRFAKTPCFILFLILDNVVNDYGKLIFNLEVLTDSLDLRVNKEEKNIYAQVMGFKQQLIKLKRYGVAIREVLMRISSRSISVISEQCKLSLYNLSSHSHTIVHEVDTIREILNGLLDQVDNALVQRMSETMRVLTAFAAIFLPLTLITGIYGMNFHYMPELNWHYGYFMALAVIVGVGILLYLLFKRKRWF